MSTARRQGVRSQPPLTGGSTMSDLKPCGVRSASSRGAVLPASGGRQGVEPGHRVVSKPPSSGGRSRSPAGFARPDCGQLGPMRSGWQAAAHPERDRRRMDSHRFRHRRAGRRSPARAGCRLTGAHTATDAACGASVGVLVAVSGVSAPCAVTVAGAEPDRAVDRGPRVRSGVRRCSSGRSRRDRGGVQRCARWLARRPRCRGRAARRG